MPKYNTGVQPLESVKLGSDLMFKSNCSYGRAFFSSGRKAHVVSVWNSGSVMMVRLAFHRPLKNLHKHMDRDLTCSWEGFRFTKAFRLEFILDHCKEV